MKRLIDYFLELVNNIRDNLSPRLPRLTEILALLVLFTMILVLLANQYISAKIIRDVGVYIIFTLTGIMGITIIMTKEMPIFLIKIRGISAIIFGALLAIGSFWLLIGGLISDIQKILQH